MSADRLLAQMLQTPVDELGLSVRAYNALLFAEVRTLGDIVRLTEADLFNVRRIGRKTASEILSRVFELGLRLGLCYEATTERGARVLLLREPDGTFNPDGPRCPVSWR